MKKLLLISLLASISVVYAQTSKLSDAEALQIVTNPQHQNDTELVMFILKSIEDSNITGIDKKTAFVDTMKVSDDIKNLVKSEIQQNITYSDHKKVSYGMYKLVSNQCNSVSGVKGNPLPNYLYLYGACYYQEYYQCNY